MPLPRTPEPDPLAVMLWDDVRTSHREWTRWINEHRQAPLDEVRLATGRQNRDRNADDATYKPETLPGYYLG